MLHNWQHHRCAELDSKQFFIERVTWCFEYSPQILKWQLFSNMRWQKEETNKSFSKDKVLVLEMWPPPGMKVPSKVPQKYRCYLHHFSEVWVWHVSFLNWCKHMTVWVGTSMSHKDSYLLHLKSPKRQVCGLNLWVAKRLKRWK